MSGAQKHTPGPWRVGESHSLLVFDGTKEGWAVADARTYHGRISCEEAEANARLIAAAPEMLEALRLVADSGHFSSYEDRAWDAVNSAIAKAEGRS